MKLCLIGYGKMGRAIEQAAMNKGHEIASKIDPKEKYTSITAEALQDAEICMDFSRPDKILTNIQQVASLGKNMVVGTTGWYHHLPEVRGWVEKNNIGFVYAPNFSIGVHLFLRLVEHAAMLINEHVQYDIAAFEAHHAKKIDIPSGTAEAMMAALLKKISRKTEVKINSLENPLEKHEIHLNSLRCGSIPGEHKVLFDSDYDTLEITHTARSRQGFAYGAVVAAEWLQGKKGFFSYDDILNTF
jgi:4-hydroxy-tetrahydrodipicolinate reductase